MVTIKLDMDVGEAAFVVDGEELPYKARSILGHLPYTPPPYLPYISPIISLLSPYYLPLSFPYISSISPLHQARNIVGTVRPCVYAYGTGMRIQVEAVGASIGSGVASGGRAVAEGLGGIELAPRASPTERLAAEARAWGLPPAAAAAQLSAAGGDAQLAVARLFSTAVALSPALTHARSPRRILSRTPVPSLTLAMALHL